MDSQVVAPVLGQDYPVTLGETFTGEQSCHGYSTMRWHFRPSTILDCTPGVLLLEPDRNRATLQLGKRGEGQVPDLRFEATYEESKDDLECIALFDGESWTLEIVDSTLKGMKYIKDVGPDDNLMERLPADEDDDDDDSGLSDDVKNILEEDPVEAQGPAQGAVAVARRGNGTSSSSSSTTSSSSSSSSSDSDGKGVTQPPQKKTRSTSPEPRLPPEDDLQPMERDFFAAPRFSSSSSSDGSSHESSDEENQ